MQQSWPLPQKRVLPKDGGGAELIYTSWERQSARYGHVPVVDLHDLPRIFIRAPNARIPVEIAAQDGARCPYGRGDGGHFGHGLGAYVDLDDAAGVGPYTYGMHWGGSY